MRGGEKVLAALGELFPDATVFTHAFRRGRFTGADGDGRRFFGHEVRESFIAALPLGRRKPQAYLPLMPGASRRLRLDGFGLIVSSESGPIKGIRKPAGARHICYCHTPMRYVWDMYDEYYRTAGFLGRLAMPLFVRHMRREDLKSADSVDLFVANSRFVAERIRRIYGRGSEVVHPPVDVGFFASRSAAGMPPAAADFEPGSYYLYAGELRDYKRPDLAVEACARMGRRLLVIGNGRLGESLRKKSAGNPGIRFTGRVGDEELKAAYAGARALLFPGVEDFGIVPVEAQASGTPVIAFGQGGALETVVDGRTGLFFGDRTVDGLCRAVEEFEARSWSPEECRANAGKFDRRRFLSEFAALCPEIAKPTGDL